MTGLVRQTLRPLRKSLALLAVILAVAGVVTAGIVYLGDSQRQQSYTWLRAEEEEGDWPPVSPDADFEPLVVLPSRMPAITKFPVKSVQAARAALNPNELVLGVTVGNASRAYPINMLTGPSREILNDTLGGRAIAATW
jgi:hypothetical protein